VVVSIFEVLELSAGDDLDFLKMLQVTLCFSYHISAKNVAKWLNPNSRFVNFREDAFRTRASL